MGFIVWFNNAGIHLLMAQRLACHIKENPEPRGRIVRKCVIKKKEGQSDEDYQKVCLKAFQATYQGQAEALEGGDEL